MDYVEHLLFDVPSILDFLGQMLEHLDLCHASDLFVSRFAKNAALSKFRTSQGTVGESNLTRLLKVSLSVSFVIVHGAFVESLLDFLFGLPDLPSFCGCPRLRTCNEVAANNRNS